MYYGHLIGTVFKRKLKLSKRNHMFRTLNKRRKNHEAACVAIVVMYLVVAVGISANHSCEVSNRRCRHSDLCNPGFHSDGKSCTGIQSEMVLHKSDNQSALHRSKTQCAACLYSTIAKSFQSRPNSRFINPGVLRISQVLPFTRIIKQSEWLSSISLRAPPLNAS